VALGGRHGSERAVCDRHGAQGRQGDAAPSRPGTALAKRLDPRAATGLARTLALVVIVGGGVLLGVPAFLVRVNSDLLRRDESRADTRS
jgi:hypothetical protein